MIKAFMNVEVLLLVAVHGLVALCLYDAIPSLGYAYMVHQGYKTYNSINKILNLRKVMREFNLEQKDGVIIGKKKDDSNDGK